MTQSHASEKKYMGVCEVCNKHNATEVVAEGTCAFIHGWTQRMCLCCFLKHCEDYKKKVDANLKKLRKRLKAEGCGLK